MEEKAKVKEMKAELVKQDFQNNLKENLEQRLFDIAYKLSHADRTLSVIQIKSMLSAKNAFGISPKYNNTELELLFKYYQEFILKVNEIQSYRPTKQDFCAFAGITTQVYNNWLKSDDDERREIMQRIEDYITDIMLTEAQNGEIKEITTMFRAKTEHGYVEAQAPVVIEHKSEIDMDKMKKQLEAIEQGKSLQTITFEKKQDGSYGMKEKE